MKETTIGKKKYKRMEGIFDIGDERFLVFKQYMLQSFEDVDKPSFLLMHNKIVKFFNKLIKKQQKSKISKPQKSKILFMKVKIKKGLKSRDKSLKFS